MTNDKPTHLVVTKSPKMALTLNKNKNWRANYLRALNIFTPDLMTSMRRRHGEGIGSQRMSNGQPKPVPMTGLRSNVFRTRKLTSKRDFIMADQVSAPIEIPTRNLMTAPKLRHATFALETCEECQPSTELNRSMVQLLSWEEPCVMLDHGGWPLEIEKSSRNNEDMSTQCTIKSWRSLRQDDIGEVCEDTEDEDMDDMTSYEDDEDDIFMMEVDGISKVENNGLRDNRGSKDRYSSGAMQCRPSNFTVFDDDQEVDVVTPLSASFVPPHQMVERGCFSLGLRDKLKRKPVTRHKNEVAEVEKGRKE